MSTTDVVEKSETYFLVNSSFVVFEITEQKEAKAPEAVHLHFLALLEFV
jgi:hypothetical protein